MLSVKIEGKKWVIYRRYNQFYSLHQDLRNSLSIEERKKLPWLPRKHYFRSGTDKNLIKLRKELLQTYLDQLVSSELILNKNFMKWLSPHSNVSTISVKIINSELIARTAFFQII